MAADANLGRFAYLLEMVIIKSNHFDDTCKTLTLIAEYKAFKLHTKTSIQKKMFFA